MQLFRLRSRWFFSTDDRLPWHIAPPVGRACAAAEPPDESFRQTALERASGWAGSCALSANLTEEPIAKSARTLKSLKSKDLSGLVRNLLCVSRVDQPSDLRGDST